MLNEERKSGTLELLIGWVITIHDNQQVRVMAWPDFEAIGVFARRSPSLALQFEFEPPILMQASNAHAIAGTAGGCLSYLMLWPLEGLRLRMSVREGNHEHALAFCRHLLKNEGILSLYKGTKPAVVSMAASQVCSI